jgi:hypothetical protein
MGTAIDCEDDGEVLADPGLDSGIDRLRALRMIRRSGRVGTSDNHRMMIVT